MNFLLYEKKVNDGLARNFQIRIGLNTRFNRLEKTEL